MSDRSIRVNLRANVADFVTNMRAAGSATDALTRDLGKAEKVSTTTMGRMAQSMRVHRESWDATGATLLKVGTAITGGVALATKAAMDWESAWTGVKKTVDGTPEQMARLESELRGLAKTLPATHTEIAGVAEAAGQLGIQTGNVAQFTRTMIDMGEATNLSADEAATSLARFANVMGTSQSKFSNIGSAVVELGNNFATTEREIVEMSTRLSSAGRQAGLTEGDVLGLATAMSSVGIEADAGGTAMSRVMIEMRKAVDQGGSKLEAFARTAGMTGEQFQAAFRENAGGAITSFIEGLGRMDKAGQSVQPVLEELGMTDIRVGNALRSAASASELFAKAIATGNSAFKENTALAAEAEQRYATAESRIKIAWNTIKDAAIDFGAAMLPVVATIAEALAGLANSFAALPGPIKAVGGGITVLAGGAALAAGAFMRLAPAALDTLNHLRNIGAVSPGVAGKIGSIVGAVGKWAPVAGAALAGLGWLMADYQRGVAHAENATRDFTEALKASNGAIDDSIRLLASQKFVDSGAAQAYERMGGNARDLVDALLEVGPAADDAKARIRAVIEANTTRTNMRGGAMWQMSEDAKLVDSEVGVMSGSLSDAQAQLELTGRMAGQAAEGQGELSDAARDTADAYAQQASAMDQALSKMREMYGIAKDTITAESDWQEAIQKSSEALKNNGATLDQTTQKGRDNWSVLLGTADAALSQAEAMAKAGDSNEAIAAKVEAARAEFIRQAVQFGATGAQAEEYANRLGLIPSEVITEINAKTDAAKQRLDAILAEIAGSGEAVTIDGETISAESSLNGLLSKIGLSREDVGIGGDDSQAIKTVGDFLAWTKRQKADSKVGANTSEGKRNVNALKDLANGRATMSVSADTSAARQAIAALSRRVISVGVSLRTQSGSSMIQERDGGVVDYYAGGGLRENHVAQIAPAGAWRVWAEPETGGESYIPLAPSKRRRSLDIWAETGRRLGVAGFADGGTVSPARQFVQPQAATAMRPLSDADVSRIAAACRTGTSEGFEGRLRRDALEARMGGGY